MIEFELNGKPVASNSEDDMPLRWVEEQVPQCGYCPSGQIMQRIGV